MIEYLMKLNHSYAGIYVYIYYIGNFKRKITCYLVKINMAIWPLYWSLFLLYLSVHNTELMEKEEFYK